MSVLSVPSPVLAKRHFDEADAGDSFDRQLGGKRSRQHYSPAAARCVQFAASGLYAVPATTLSALLALFPGMDERTVSNVLSECGNNIDAAIRRLGELRLSATAENNPSEAAAPSALPPASPAPGLHRTVADSVGPLGTPAALGATSAAAAAAASPGSGIAAAAAGGPASLAGGGGVAGGSGTGGPVTAEQWVDFLVAEMSAAADLDNARQRAAAFLSQFEAFVSRFVRQQQQQQQQQQGGEAGVTDGAAAAGASAGGLAARAAKLAEENAVLKKAVQIQHRQLQERAAQDAEVGQLKALLAQYQEQVRTLQVSNYSLSLHLQKATNAGGLGQPRNPDVF